MLTEDVGCSDRTRHLTGGKREVEYGKFKSKVEDAPGTNVTLGRRVGVTDNFKLEDPVTAHDIADLLQPRRCDKRVLICHIRKTRTLASTVTPLNSAD